MQEVKKILVVEDEADIREIIEHILTDSGYEVSLSPDATSFAEKFEELSPDLILMDIRLPDGNGLELCKRVKNSPSTSIIPIIMMSAHYQPNELLEDACGDDFMPKPFDIDHLLYKVAHQLSS